MSEGKSYTPPFRVGEPISGGLVAEATVNQHSQLLVGAVVVGDLAWHAYTLSDGMGLQRVLAGSSVPISYYLDILGMPGLTAYFSLLGICQPKAGETVVVSGATGAVGSVVGQLAKMRGLRGRHCRLRREGGLFLRRIELQLSE